jgi:hypothetical protein
VIDSSKGISSAQFDPAVKNMGSPFLIVIKTNAGYTFGAYVHDLFNSGSGWVQGSSQTFLFSFGSQLVPPYPVKLLHKGSGQGIHLGHCGLHLGSDLVAFCSHSCTPSIYTQVAPGYSATVNDRLLAGESNYTPNFMEVFSVTAV